MKGRGQASQADPRRILRIHGRHARRPPARARGRL